MLQQVNLLVRELQPVRVVLDLKQTIFGMAFVVAVLALVAGGKGWQLASVHEVTTNLKSELEATTRSMLARVDMQTLNEQLANLEVERAAVQAQAHTLQGAQRLTGFSEQFRIFSESAIAGLWLTEFSVFRSPLGEPSVNLSGRAHAPSHVAHYVEGLKAHGGLDGYTFADIEVIRDERDSRFVLHGAAGGADANSD